MALRDEITRESARWVEQEIIDADQRARLLSLYPDAPGGDGLSLGVLAIFWVGGALLFLGVAFLLAIVWSDLGPLRALTVGAIDAGFFALGFLLLRHRRGLERTAMALLVIGALLLPPALGVAWTDLFGSSGHPLPLVALCTAIYGVFAFRLRSHAFSVLFVLGLFFVGEEVIRDDDFNALVPLVQLGLVRDLGEVFPIVFYSLAAFVTGAAWLAGRVEGFSHLRPTLWVCALLLGLLPGLVGGVHNHNAELHTALAIVASLGGMALSIVLREKKAFWVAGAGLVVAFLILFSTFFEDSMAFTCFAIVLGAAILGAASYLAVKKNTWLDRLFAEPAPAPATTPAPATPPTAPEGPAS